MKLSFYISLIALIGISTMQAASAQEEPRVSARFNYAPNVWRAESARLPKGYGSYQEPQHNVRSGSVPQNDILGVDPMMLSKPAPASPVVTTATRPKLMAPQTNANFNPAFGKPIMAQLPSVIPQHAFALPMTPQAPMTKPAAAIPAQAAKSQVKQVVMAHMARPAFRNAKPAAATPEIATYGGKFYSPGAILPHSGSRGASGANTSVTGKVILQHSH